MDEAARDIEMLRMALARIADQDATFSVIGGNIIVDVEPTLADAEREALVSVLNRLCGEMTQDERQTLIGLLERMGKPTESE